MRAWNISPNGQLNNNTTPGLNGWEWYLPFQHNCRRNWSENIQFPQLVDLKNIQHLDWRPCYSSSIYLYYKPWEVSMIIQRSRKVSAQNSSSFNCLYKPQNQDHITAPTTLIQVKAAGIRRVKISSQISLMQTKLQKQQIFLLQISVMMSFLLTKVEMWAPLYDYKQKSIQRTTKLCS